MTLSPESLLAPRYRPGEPMVESWFVRANDPSQPRAVWLRSTLRTREGASDLLEFWCLVFHGGRAPQGWRLSIPLESGGLESSPTRLQGAGCRFEYRPDRGSCSGRIESDHGPISWEIAWSRLPGTMGEPLLLHAADWILESPFPRNKLVTPLPAARFEGRLELPGASIDLGGWYGMNGHNWGREQPARYAWGQCHFFEGSELVALMEAFSVRLKLGQRESPLLSALVLRTTQATYRFDRLLDLWNQDARIDDRDYAYALDIRGHQDRCVLYSRAVPVEVAGLGYLSPNGSLASCLNSKLARTTLLLEHPGSPPREFESPHGGALEFLVPGADSRHPHLI